jgi:N-acetyl-gamma-glutamyl-phosphate reductase
MTKVFIDGKEGTTGLRIYDRLSERDDLELITLPEKLRKDASLRKQALNECDVALLCLPDAAAIEAVEMGKTRTPALSTLPPRTALRRLDVCLPEAFDGGFEAVKPQAGCRAGCHASGLLRSWLR